MSTALIAYIPVFHQGYWRFLEKYSQTDVIFLISEDILALFPHLHKDIRALAPNVMRDVLQTLLPSQKIEVLGVEMLQTLPGKFATFFMPDEDIMHELAEKYLTIALVEFDTVFLRWDKKKSLSPEIPKTDETISQTEFDQKMMQLAYKQAAKSADWWRHVGAVLVKEGQVLLTANNHYVPDEQQAYYDGDPRGNFHKGVCIELGIAMHAEAEIICQAAKQGISTTDCDLYVSTFPCPACAKLVAYSGIKKLYFSEGYSLVNGAEVMRENGIELVKVK